MKQFLNNKKNSWLLQAISLTMKITGINRNQIRKEGMKRIFIIALLAGLALQQALSQTNAPETSQSAQSGTDTNVPTASAMSTEAATAVATNQAVDVTADTNSPAMNDQSAAATNSPAPENVSIPLISFQDV